MRLTNFSALECDRCAVYIGRIRHRRYFPTPHGFDYPIFMSYLDLDQLDAAFQQHRFFSRERWNLVQFRRKDFYGDANIPLKTAILDLVCQTSGERPTGTVCLLTHLRHFGLSFNPVSFYYCFQRDGSLHSIVAEITNTPWRERHAYVLLQSRAAQHGSALHFDFDKAFHVSPFLPMDRAYSWRFQPPETALRVHMQVLLPPAHAGSANAETLSAPANFELQFDSTLNLVRNPWNSANLSRALLRFPLITLSVVMRIYWHALLLRFKKNPFYDHPDLTAPKPDLKL